VNQADATPAPAPWFERNATAVVLGLAGIGFVLRVVVAAPTFLNPDEALNFLSADRPTLAGAIRYGMYNPHPPLYYILLWLWRFLGRSDLVLRLPSVLAGTAAVWVGYRWLSAAFNRRAGLVGATLLAFAPEMVALSAEVRSYVLEILIVLLALWCLERGLRGSARAMLLTGLVLALAILTHYSALPVAVALGGYALAELVRRRPPSRVWLAWAGGQALAAGTGLMLYLVHIRALRGGAMEVNARGGWLASSYFQPGTDSLLWFPLRQTWAVFRYAFSSPVAGAVGLALFAAALALLLSRRGRGQRDRVLLLALPFAVVLAAAVAGLHPYGGSRHSFFLVAFAVAGVSLVLAELAGRRTGHVVIGLAVLAVPWLLAARPGGGQYIPPRDQARARMEAALGYVRELAPGCRLVFSDQQTQVLLQHYLGNRGETADRGDYLEYRDGDLLLVRPAGAWLMDAARLAALFPKLERDYRLAAGDPVIVVFAGWGYDLLQGYVDRFRSVPPAAERFGGRISVFVLGAAGDGLDSLAARAGRELPGRLRTVLWPTGYLTDSSRVLAAGIGGEVLSYEELYAALESGRDLDELVPALALWRFAPLEIHEQLLQLMDGRHSYIAGGFRFVLLGTDPTGAVAAYVLDLDRGP
jgi:hypothetical protein